MMAENKKLEELYCTGCNYCMPCPQGINIPYIFRLMNYNRVYGLKEYAMEKYKNLKTEGNENGKDASYCIECGSCESKCPQHLKIIQQLKDTNKALLGD
jgi:hypothetical protein